LDCFGNANGGREFPALWVVGLIALALTGDRAHALRPGRARRCTLKARFSQPQLPGNRTQRTTAVLQNLWSSANQHAVPDHSGWRSKESEACS